MLKKQKYPILEFDDALEAKINPNEIKSLYPSLPEKLIITFFKDAIIKMLDEGIIKEFFTITGENNLVIYKFVKAEICIIHGIIGGAACGGFYEELISLGVKKTMFCGGGGALRKDLTIGKLIIVDSAIRDEGMSYHYLAPSRDVNLDFSIVKIISQYLKAKEIDFIIGKVWTTDAFFRETENKIKLRQAEGALLVEMEQAGLIAISNFRQVQYGAIIYAGDDLSGEVWDRRGWHDKTDLRKGLISFCIEILNLF